LLSILPRISFHCVFDYTEFNNYHSNHAKGEKVATEDVWEAVPNDANKEEGAWREGWSIRNATTQAINIAPIPVASDKHNVDSSIVIYDQHEVELEIKTKCFENGCIVYSRFDSKGKETKDTKEEEAAKSAEATEENPTREEAQGKERTRYETKSYRLVDTRGNFVWLQGMS